MQMKDRWPPTGSATPTPACILCILLQVCMQCRWKIVGLQQVQLHLLQHAFFVYYYRYACNADERSLASNRFSYTYSSMHSLYTITGMHAMQMKDRWPPTGSATPTPACILCILLQVCMQCRWKIVGLQQVQLHLVQQVAFYRLLQVCMQCRWKIVGPQQVQLHLVQQVAFYRLLQVCMQCRWNIVSEDLDQLMWRLRESEFNFDRPTIAGNKLCMEDRWRTK